MSTTKRNAPNTAAAQDESPALRLVPWPGFDEWEASQETPDEPPQYVDMANYLSVDRLEPERPTVFERNDGVGLFYASKCNLLYGGPETGKTWVLLAAGVSEMFLGRSFAFVDMDHNGRLAIATALVGLGATVAMVSDPCVFRYYEPEDRDHLLVMVKELVAARGQWLVGLDSVGELIPMFGKNSNNPDDYTAIVQAVVKPLIRTEIGKTVVLVDHGNKSPESIDPTGTIAKKRVINGAAYLVVSVKDSPFIPGRGGANALYVYKDRPGSVRSHCPPPTGPLAMQSAGVFRMAPSQLPRDDGSAAEPVEVTPLTVFPATGQVWAAKNTEHAAQITEDTGASLSADAEWLANVGIPKTTSQSDAWDQVRLYIERERKKSKDPHRIAELEAWTQKRTRDTQRARKTIVDLP